LVAIPEAIRQLSEDGRILQLNKGGAMDNELRRASLRVLVRYARRLLKFHLSAYRDTAQVMDLVTSDVTSSGLRPLLEAVLLRRCRELYRALDVQVPESLTETTGSGDGSDEVLKQFNVLKKEAASPDGQRER
jgi:type I site-specific restriction endonuclease